jgi:ribonuclease R
MKIDKNKLEEMCKHISSREIVASKAQRDSIKFKQAEYLQDKIGQEFDGVVSSITEWGMYIELVDTKCEGIVKYQSMNGKWDIDVKNYTISSADGSSKIRLGDVIVVVVKSIDLEKKQIDFIISNGKEF